MSYYTIDVEPGSLREKILHARADLGSATRLRRTEQAVEARQRMKSLITERAIREAIDNAPPITEEQRIRLAGILLAGIGGAQ